MLGVISQDVRLPNTVERALAKVLIKNFSTSTYGCLRATSAVISRQDFVHPGFLHSLITRKMSRHENIVICLFVEHDAAEHNCIVLDIKDTKITPYVIGTISLLTDTLLTRELGDLRDTKFLTLNKCTPVPVKINDENSLHATQPFYPSVLAANQLLQEFSSSRQGGLLTIEVDITPTHFAEHVRQAMNLILDLNVEHWWGDAALIPATSDPFVIRCNDPGIWPGKLTDLPDDIAATSFEQLLDALRHFSKMPKTPLTHRKLYQAITVIEQESQQRKAARIIGDIEALMTAYADSAIWSHYLKNEDIPYRHHMVAHFMELLFNQNLALSRSSTFAALKTANSEINNELLIRLRALRE